MIELQLLNKVLQDGNLNLFIRNGIDRTYFKEFHPEYDFIVNHYNTYKRMPDRETIIGNNQLQFEFFTVNESEEYLVNAAKEQYLFDETVKTLTTISSKLEVNSFEAVEYLKSVLPNLMKQISTGGVDLTKDRTRLYEIEDKKNGSSQVISTGLKELDEVIYGWLPGEELVTVVARLGQGKTWLLLWFAVAAWKQGKRVGIYSGEMSSSRIGYRIDTLIANFSNKDLLRGTIEDVEGYKQYLDTLEQKGNPIIVLSKKELKGRATVSQLKNFALTNNLDILCIDQYTLLEDERATRGTSRAERLEHISSDLFDASIDLGIPIIVLSQANRDGDRADEDGGGTPDVKDIYGSDSIGQNATKVITIRQTGAGFEMSVKKNRDDKFGQTLLYYWDFDKGIITYIPNGTDKQYNPSKVDDVRKRYNDARDVF